MNYETAAPACAIPEARLGSGKLLEHSFKTVGQVLQLAWNFTGG